MNVAGKEAKSHLNCELYFSLHTNAVGGGRGREKGEGLGITSYLKDKPHSHPTPQKQKRKVSSVLNYIHTLRCQ